MTLLTGGRIFTGLSGAETRVADVLVEGALISAVEPSMQRGPDMEVIDVSGCTILPGLINLHEHLTLKRTFGPVGRQLALPDEYLLIRGVRAALREIRAGITTVRELGARGRVSLALKHSIDAGAIPGPRVMVARLLSATAGHSRDVSVIADGPEGLRQATRAAIGENMDWIKVIGTNDPVRVGLDGEYSYPEITAAELGACVDEAHRRCVRVAVHAMGTKALGEIIGCEPDTIEHGVYLNAALAGEMARRGIALVPTLSGYRQTMVPELGRGEDWAARHKLLVEPHERSFLQALEAGVMMGVGTDTAGDYVEELQMMVGFGMSPQLALEAATRVNASILGLGDQIGTIESGKIADLLVVTGDPITDLEVLRSVRLVVQGGKARRPSEIDIFTGDETQEWNTLSILPLLQQGRLV